MVAAELSVLTCSCGHGRILVGKEPSDLYPYPLPGRLPLALGSCGAIYLGGRVLTEQEYWELEHKECRR